MKKYAIKSTISICISLILIALAFFLFNRTNITQEDVETKTTVNSNETVKEFGETRLYISKDKLDVLLGKGFVPIMNKFVNLDSDAEEEYLIAFKKKNSEYVYIYFFDIVQNDVIRKQFSLETTITDTENLLIQSQNLFFQNDIYIIVEGKTADNKQIVYLISYENNQYNVVDIFTGDFSVLLNYEEIENDKGKYDILSDVSVVNNSFSTTNVNIKRRDVYKWNYTTKSFYKSESTEIRSEGESVNSLIYGSEDKYFEYISGFWYPSEYKSLIDNEKLNVKDFDYKSIQFIYFNKDSRQVSVKFGDYIETYNILRVSKIWGKKPGLRFRIVDSNNKENNSYPKSMDIYLMSSIEVKVVGPHKYATNNYVRLAKPFLEYVYDREQEINAVQMQEINTFLRGDFYNSFENLTLSFIDDKRLAIVTKNETINCYYKINHNEKVTMMSLVNCEKGIFGKQNFIVSFDFKNGNISLMPIKLSVNGFTMDNIKSYMFIKSF